MEKIHHSAIITVMKFCNWVKLNQIIGENYDDKDYDEDDDDDDVVAKP